MLELFVLFLSICLSFLSVYTRKSKQISLKEKYVLVTFLVCAGVIFFFSSDNMSWKFIGYFMVVPPVVFFVERLFRLLSIKFQNRDFDLYLRGSNEIEDSFFMRGKNPHVTALDIVFSISMLGTIMGLVLLGVLYLSPFKKRSTNVDETNWKDHSDISSSPPVIESVYQRNYRDTNGWKQGVWDIYKNGVLKGFETYSNDTLDGLAESWINYPGQRIRGSYEHGSKTGCWMHFENDSNLVMVVSYENDNAIWTGFPLADYNYPKPVKGFSIESDSVLIECPHANNVIWYRGLFLKKKPVGLHRMYYPNGNIKFECDYSTGRTKQFDVNGREK